MKEGANEFRDEERRRHCFVCGPRFQCSKDDDDDAAAAEEKNRKKKKKKADIAEWVREGANGQTHSLGHPKVERGDYQEERCRRRCLSGSGGGSRPLSRFCLFGYLALQPLLHIFFSVFSVRERGFRKYLNFAIV